MFNFEPGCKMSHFNQAVRMYLPDVIPGVVGCLYRLLDCCYVRQRYDQHCTLLYFSGTPPFYTDQGQEIDMSRSLWKECKFMRDVKWNSGI